MDNKDWVILKTVYDEKNITKAADRLFMAQPTMTYRLQQIEKELDITLLYRGRRGVEFTQQGEFLVKYADDMLVQFRKMEETLHNLGHTVRGTLRIAAARAIALYTLPGILKAFKDIFPDVDFTVNTGLNADLIQSVYKQDAHVGIVRGDHHWPNEKQIISEEKICIVSKDEIDIKLLPFLPRIDYQTDPALDMVIDNWWKDNYKKPPLFSMNVDNMEIAKKMAINGLGYTIVPSIVLEENKDLYQIELTNAKGEPIKWTTWILYRKEFLHLSTVKEFVKFLTNHL
ncbi:LysR family transcriptional regulator [Priestia megaterium]|uniref:LysR family transcriptional regulator n=1 Tax=Priestia megaterium TaxID=1404 RepID=UPI001780A9D9|nr:LysR family transcriptional regulator [Priestia megaterium]MBD8114845.1 LysR family transcriptional regulator [Priestia megaterium]